jgi:hypothetical protein
MRKGLIGGLLAAAMVLVGCANVPDHGGVHAAGGGSSGSDVTDEPVRFLVHGPSTGDKPDDIVNGFLTASAGSEADHAIARLYLTTSAARTWVPSVRAQIYDETAPNLVGVAQLAGSTVTVPVRAPLVASIAGDGGYTVAPAGSELRVALRLVKQRGEWRIANPPSGLLLSRENVNHALSAQFVYFLNRDLSTVVPNTVFLPASGQALATSMMRWLLRGPTSWLGPAVRTAIPAGTTLEGPVPIVHGTAIVNLSQEVLDSTAAQRAQLSAQIVWTLTGVPTVTKVRLLVDGNPLDVTPAGTSQARDDWPTYDPGALSAAAQGFFRSGERVVTISGGHLPGPLGTTPTTLQHVAVSPDLAFIGGLRTAAGRTSVYVGSLATEPRVVYSGAGPFTAPSWDRDGELWTVQLSPRPRVLLIRPGQQVVQIPAPSLDGQVVRALRISRDGTRVAVIVGTTQTQLLVGRVRTTSSGLRLDGFINPAALLRDVTNATWADANTVLVLAHAVGRARIPWLVDVDGVRPAPVTTTGLTSYDAVAGAPGQPTLVESDGEIYQAARGFWTPVARGVEPAYPG